MTVRQASILFSVAVLAGWTLNGQAASRPDGSNPNCTDISPYECGWWWKKHKPEPQPAPEITPPEPAQDTIVETDCTDPGQWQPKCGFIDPGSDYAFQSQQRDALMQRMVMHPNSPAAVRGFQEYNQWVFDRAIAIGRMWRWNMVQDPSLDPLTATPLSQFGLNLVRQEQSNMRARIYQVLDDQDAIFVYFSRSDCDYCYAMTPILERLHDNTHLPIYDASLDAHCMEGFVGDECMTAPDTLRPARTLNVQTVPALFLYLPDDNQWIRLASGVTTVSKLESRIRLFVGAVRAASENAVANASESPAMRPSVDFQRTHQIKELARYGLGDGVERKSTDEQ